MFHPLALSVHDLWQQSLHNPSQLGCYLGDEGRTDLQKNETAIVDPLATYDSAKYAIGIGLSLRALNVDNSQSDRWLAVAENAVRGCAMRSRSDLPV